MMSAEDLDTILNEDPLTLEDKDLPYNPKVYKKAHLRVLKKLTHHVKDLTFTKDSNEHVIDTLKIVCHGAFIDPITPHFKGYWAFIEIFEKQKTETGSESKLIFSNWINSQISTFEHPEWIIHLIDVVIDS
jgi:hypothetical protein